MQNPLSQTMLNEIPGEQLAGDVGKEQFLGSWDNFMTEDCSLLTCWTDDPEEELEAQKKQNLRSLRAISNGVLNLIKDLKCTTYSQIAEYILAE